MTCRVLKTKYLTFSQYERQLYTSFIFRKSSISANQSWKKADLFGVPFWESETQGTKLQFRKRSPLLIFCVRRQCEGAPLCTCCVYRHGRLNTSIDLPGIGLFEAMYLDLRKSD